MATHEYYFIRGPWDTKTHTSVSPPFILDWRFHINIYIRYAYALKSRGQSHAERTHVYNFRLAFNFPCPCPDIILEPPFLLFFYFYYRCINLYTRPSNNEAKKKCAPYLYSY